MPNGNGDDTGDRAYVSRRKRRRTAPAAADLAVDASASLPAAPQRAPPPPAPAVPSRPPSPPPPSPASLQLPTEDEAQEARWARLERDIHVDGRAVPPAVFSFESMSLPPSVLRALQSRGVRAPTDVQAQTIPCVLRGRDVVALAATGSGKTLSYLLPLLALATNHQAQPSPPPLTTHTLGRVASPLALVLVPTRELMDQVLHELLSFPVLPPGPSPPPPWGHLPPVANAAAALRPVPAVGVCGGVAVQQQVARLQALAHELAAVVATPGRLLHLLAMQAPAVLDLRAVRYLVVDEVDRMLETELEQQLRQILRACSRDAGGQRQTLLFSATMPHFLDRVARSAVVDAVTVRVGMGRQGTGALAAAVLGVRQTVLFMRFAEKKARLLQVLRAIPRPPVLVFCNSHASVAFVTRLLQSEQFHAAPLHGEQTQAYRFQVLEAFRQGFVDVLVATDLAARGLDFRDVDHVVVFDMPHAIEDYVHRCGRTGRRREQDAATGEQRRVGGSVTAFLTAECAIASELKALLQEAKQPVPRELALPSRFHAPAR